MQISYVNICFVFLHTIPVMVSVGIFTSGGELES